MNIIIIIIILVIIYIIYDDIYVEYFQNVHVDIGNYLSDYYYNLVISILKQEDFNYKTSTVVFIKDLPTYIPFNNLIYDEFQKHNITFDQLQLKYINKDGTWFWILNEKFNETINFIMKNTMNRIIKDALIKNNFLKKENIPIIHFRCADTPFNHHKHYHFQKYEYFKVILDNLNTKYNDIILLSCNTHGHKSNDNISSCNIYANKIKEYLQKLNYNIHIKCDTNMEDFARLFWAPVVISTTSSFSFMAGFFGEGDYYQPSMLEHNNSLCPDCKSYNIHGYSIEHDKINNYHDTDRVFLLLNQQK